MTTNNSWPIPASHWF